MPNSKSKARAARSFERSPATAQLTKFTYALAAYTAEIRDDGWFVAKTMPSFGERMVWHGPYPTIIEAAATIAQQCATEITARHTRSTTWHRIAAGAPLYGLADKQPTRTRRSKSSA